MKVLVDLGDLDSAVADEDEVASIVREAILGAHELENGETLRIDPMSVTVTIVDSTSSKAPARSFLAWLRRNAEREDPIGDLALDVKDEKGAPKGRASKNAWISYLRSRYASRVAMDAFYGAWREFERA